VCSPNGQNTLGFFFSYILPLVKISPMHLWASTRMIINIVYLTISICILPSPLLAKDRDPLGTTYGTFGKRCGVNFAPKNGDSQKMLHNQYLFYVLLITTLNAIMCMFICELILDVANKPTIFNL